VLVEDRNRVVLADLKKLIDEKTGLRTIAIIYGAGHLPSMERALVGELGYAPVGDTWREAISVDAKEAGINPQQMKAMRKMVESSMQGAVRREQRKQDGDPKRTETAEQPPAGK